MTTPNKQATVFIIEDDAAIGRSLRWLLESINLQVEIYLSATEYLAVYDPNRYGCLLIDIRLPDMSGLKLQEQLVQLNNPIPIIIITGHGDIASAVRAMKLGAKDFILKPYNNELLLEQIQTVLAESCHKQNSYSQFTKRVAQLTKREREVMELVVAGKLNKQIAHILGITLSTVEQHRSHLMQKIGVKNLAELMRAHFLLSHNQYS